MHINTEIVAGVARVTIDHPAKKNALSYEMRVELRDTFARLGADPAVRAMMLEGAGRDFCSGADVDKMLIQDARSARERQKVSHQMILNLYNMEKPVVAVVRGVAAGMGWSLALACDYVIAGDSARFAQLFKRVGLAPDAGSAWFLSQQIGSANARQLAYTGRFIYAKEALSSGLISRLLPEEDLEASSLEEINELANSPTFALGLSKKLFQSCAFPPLESYLREELNVQAQLKQTHDFKEGLAAFKEKRKPIFTGC